MIELETRSDYEDYLEHVALNRVIADPSPFRHVAQNCIQSIQVTSRGTSAITTNASPYVGSEYDYQRLTPRQVLCRHGAEEIYEAGTTEWREAAVRLLAADVEHVTTETQIYSYEEYREVTHEAGEEPLTYDEWRQMQSDDEEES